MLFNQTKQKIIMQKTRFASTAWQRFKGLMFEKKEWFDFALVFDFGSERRAGASIHMLFVFFSIDAVFLNAKKKVVDIAGGLKPFILNYTPKQKARYLVELPAGKGRDICINDTLAWTQKNFVPFHTINKRVAGSLKSLANQEKKL